MELQGKYDILMKDISLKKDACDQLEKNLERKNKANEEMDTRIKAQESEINGYRKTISEKDRQFSEQGDKRKLIQDHLNQKKKKFTLAALCCAGVFR